MNKISRNKNKWIVKLIALFSFGLLFSICVSISSADIEIPDIEEGDGIWATIDVDSPRSVDVTAWTNGNNNDNIKLYLYNQTHLVAIDTGSYDQVSIDDFFARSLGTYTVMAYLTDAFGGGTRMISITSKPQLSELPKYGKANFGVVEGKAIYFNLNVDEEGWIFLNAWTNGSNNDNIKLSLSNQTHLVAIDTGSYDQVSIAYLAPSADIYTIKAYLTDAFGGGTRTVSLTSNYLIYENGGATPSPTPTSKPTEEHDPRYSIDIQKSSETAPEIVIESIKQNSLDEKYVVSGSAYSDSGIKSVVVNGIFVGTELWSVNLSGDNNTIFITGNDGNTTLANLILTDHSSEIGRESWISKNFILIISLLSFLFGSGIIIKIITIYQNNKK